MNAYAELRERRHALLFTVEQRCRRHGITRWTDLHHYLLAAIHTPQGRDLLLDTAEVEQYLTQRQQQCARATRTPADRTAARILAARERQLADAFAHLIEALPSLDSTIR
ncbi:MAG: hypothetical protein BWY76_00799 [bacterium ADurb.Bin429]|nr:MAG: hypothetical protein BWY76_00799 [bacterium ADurb.Bin429]